MATTGSVRTLVVTGSPCAGKSTACAALAASGLAAVGAPTALVDLDAMRWQMKSGLKNPMAELPPGDEALAQWQLAVDLCGDAARRYDAVPYDYGCVVDAPGIYRDDRVPWPQYARAAWERALEGVPWRLVVLLPDLDLVLARAEARQGVRQPPEAILRAIHDMMSLWRDEPDVVVVDNTDLTVEETVERLRQAAGA